MKGFSAEEFFREYLQGDLCYLTLLSWCDCASLPLAKHISVLRKIESIVNIPSTHLTAALPRYIVNPPAFDKITTIGKRLQRLVKNPYAMWTENLEEEFKDLIRYKTAIIPPSIYGEKKIRSRH
jgi:hypothetical protein